MNPHKEQKNFEDYKDYIHYQVHECVTPIDHPYYKGVFNSHLRIIKEYLGDFKRNVSILDCGCGYGFALRAFRCSGYTNVIGTDISEDRLTEARKVGYPLLKLDMHLMQGIRDSAFDIVYSSHSLEHGLYPDRALAEVHRILKPDGIFMLILPYPVMLDDDHVKKAHCGATYLHLTTIDGGEALMRRIETFGFSLVKQGTGAYRNEAEIYLEFTKGNIAALVKEYGPHETTAGTKFNVQPNGMSALWFIIEDPYNSDLVVEFDGYILKSTRFGDVLSALVPDSLIVTPRQVVISVFDANRIQRSIQLDFNVKVKMAVKRRASVVVTGKGVKSPNLFIVGAPRSATTSLYWKLAGHPDIYMSRVKEPFFFDERAHGVLSNAISTEDEYKNLFRYVSFQAKVVGEASVTYLSSIEALERIRAFNEDAKIIVMLRDPIVASVSMYLRMRQGGKYEDAPNFEDAWRNSHSNKRSFVTRYAELFLIGNQLSNAMSIFQQQNLKVILFDDIVKDCVKVYHEVLKFLELPIDSNEPFPKGNSAEWSDIHDHVSKNLLDEMVGHFRPQVKIIADLTNRNLDHWLVK